MDPFCSRDYTLHGKRIHARVSEAAPEERLPMVLVHGLSVSGAYMLPLGRALAGDFPIYIPDLPGFGFSYRPRRVLGVVGLAAALLGWLDAAGLAAPLLIGNSMGCQVIAALAERWPDRLRGAAWIGPTMDPGAPTALGQIARGLVNMLYEPPALIPVLLRDYLMAGPRRTFGTLRLALADPMLARLPRVGVPVLVLRGQHDTIVSQPWLQEVDRRLPNATLAVISGGAHAANFDAAESVAGLVKNWIGNW